MDELKWKKKYKLYGSVYIQFFMSVLKADPWLSAARKGVRIDYLQEEREREEMLKILQVFITGGYVAMWSVFCSI